MDKSTVVYKIDEAHQIEVEIAANTQSESGRVRTTAAETAIEMLDKPLDTIKQFTTKLYKAMEEAAPHEYEVTFGVKLGGKTGIILASGSVETNLTIKIKWKRDPNT